MQGQRIAERWTPSMNWLMYVVMKIYGYVDGAYGAAAILSEKGRELLSGIHRADSLTLDPHKWLFSLMMLVVYLFEIANI